jgi:hypothetical protein
LWARQTHIHSLGDITRHGKRGEAGSELQRTRYYEDLSVDRPVQFHEQSPSRSNGSDSDDENTKSYVTSAESKEPTVSVLNFHMIVADAGLAVNRSRTSI